MSRRTSREQANDQGSNKRNKPFYLGDSLRIFYLVVFAWSIFSHAIIGMGLYEFEAATGGSEWGEKLDTVLNVLCFVIPASAILFTHILVDSEG